MANVKTAIIATDCRAGNTLYKKGQVFTYDEDDKGQMQTVALMNHAGRLAPPEMRARIDAELADEAKKSAKGDAPVPDFSSLATAEASKAVTELGKVLEARFDAALAALPGQIATEVEAAISRRLKK